MKKYRCVLSCYMSGFGIVRAGQVIEFGDDAAKSSRVKKNFVCMTKDDIRKDEDKKALEKDLTYKAKVERLKDAKVNVPRNVSKETIDKLFKEHIEKVSVGE